MAVFLLFLCVSAELFLSGIIIKNSITKKKKSQQAMCHLSHDWADLLGFIYG